MEPANRKNIQKLPTLDFKHQDTGHGAFLTGLMTDAEIKPNHKFLGKRSGSVAATPDSEDQNYTNKKILYFLDKGLKHQLDFNSPRTISAAVELGITFEDCIKKCKEDFMSSSIDSRLCKLKYEHHCRRVLESLKSVYELRENRSIFIGSNFH